jgi:hypothetical protein
MHGSGLEVYLFCVFLLFGVVGGVLFFVTKPKTRG